MQSLTKYTRKKQKLATQEKKLHTKKKTTKTQQQKTCIYCIVRARAHASLFLFSSTLGVFSHLAY